MEPDLGVNQIDCVQCTLHASSDWLEFGAEPVLRGIRPGGPADGKLEDGDVLVAVDGTLITTEAGGRRFAAPAVGRPLRLTVRRGGHDVTVTIVPSASCANEAEGHQEQPAQPAPAPTHADRGWLGFALQCGPCSSQDLPDGSLMWTFENYPGIVEVAATGPAGKARLRPGDLIRAIDGVALTTAEGGRRFGAVQPGDRVRLTIERQGVIQTVTLIAGRRPPVP